MLVFKKCDYIFFAIISILFCSVVYYINSRPDFVVHVDHESGCQYLVARSGGVTPRLDEDAIPICKGTARIDYD